MSSNLANSAALLADSSFLGRVKAAMTEEAMSVAVETGGTFESRTPRISLAMAIVFDADAHVRTFATLCADDATNSAAPTPADVTDADIRRVITSMWGAVAASTPNLP